MLIVSLIAVGLLMYNKVGNVLNDTLEQNIARQTADLLALTEERFNSELAELQFASDFISTSPAPEMQTNVLARLDKHDPRISVGLLQLDGNAIIGQSLSEADFPRLSMAAHGNNVIDYCKGKGLLFAVPVMNGDNIRAIVYRLYADDLLAELFGLTGFSSAGRILIQDRNGQLVVPYKNYGDEDKAFFADPTIVEGFNTIRHDLLDEYAARAASIYYEGPRGKLFLFGADLPQTNCAIMGYVPWSAVAGSISHINNMIILVTSLMLMLFPVASVCMLLINGKAMQFEHAKIQADEANRAKSAFLAGISHEIRSPLNAVLGMNEMILRECREPNIINYARNSASAGESLLALINNILDFSKIESGKMELVEENYQLDNLIRGLVNIVKPRAEKKNLTFNLFVNPNVPNELFGDSARTRQIVVNLLTNAVKYTQAGNVDFSVDMEQRTGDRIMLKFAVKDTGIGIREEDRQKLFSDFQRLDSQKNRNIEGTGLGLAITYRLVQMMNGRVEVDSVYGKGSTFRVFLPVQVTSEAIIGNFDMDSTPIETEVYQASFVAPNAKILVVDDNEMNLLVVTSLLKETHIQIDTVLSGTEALTKLAVEKYDVVFLDHMMPDLDGIQTLKLARDMKDNKNKNAPVIALTANAILGAREMFLREGFSDYLSKPVRPNELEEMLRKYLPPEKIAAPMPVTSSSMMISQTTYESFKPELGLMYCGGNVEVYRDILSVFCRLRENEQAKLQAALDIGDWQNYLTLIHGLKSTSLSIGGEQTSAAAKKLETACKAKDFAYVRSHHAQAMKLYDRLVEDGKHYIEVGEGSARGAAD